MFCQLMIALLSSKKLEMAYLLLLWASVDMQKAGPALTVLPCRQSCYHVGAAGSASTDGHMCQKWQL